MNVVCVCGLAAEARIARAAGFAAVGGAGCTVCATEAMATADFLVSFGIAGGLVPRLKPGTVILSGEVVTEDRRFETAPHVAAALAGWAERAGAEQGAIYGSRTILATPRDKALRGASAGSPLAVDLESGPVAREAADRGIPFVVLRAIADPAWRALPPAALLPLAKGRPDLPRVLGSVARRPGQIPALIGLAAETRQALGALVAPARALRGLIGP